MRRGFHGFVPREGSEFLFDETQLHKTVNILAAAAIPPISLARVQRAGGFERGPEPRSRAWTRARFRVSFDPRLWLGALVCPSATFAWSRPCRSGSAR